MPSLDAPLIKGNRKVKLDYRDNLPVNMIAVLEPIIAEQQGYLLTHDGLTKFADTGGLARGGTYNERFEQHFRLSGTDFESIAPDGTVTKIGNIGGTSTASFANSFNSQVIVAEGRAYWYDNGTFKEYDDPDLGFPIDVTWFRGIYVFTDSESLYQTDINDELSISPLKFTSSEFAADPIVGVERNDQNQILAFNRYSIEYFVFNANAGEGETVLANVTGKGTKIGIVGTHCKCELDGIFFLLGGRREEAPTIYTFLGGQAQNISTREVDKLIAQYTEQELRGVVMESRVVARDKFVIVHLPNETLIYNHAIGKVAGVKVAWSIVKSATDTDEVWRGIHGVFDLRNAQWIYGDKFEPLLGYLDNTTAAQYENDTEIMCYTPILPLEKQSIFEFEIQTITGFDPTEFTSAFSLSYDGVQWGTEYWNKINVYGDYSKRYIARRLGYVRDDVSMRLRFIGKSKMAFSALVFEYG